MNYKFNFQYYSWPIGIVVFLVTVVTFNIWFLMFSVKVQRDIVEPNPYEKGLDYEARLDELRRNDFLLQMNYDRSAIVADLKSKDGKEISGARVIATFIHPSDSSLDKQLELLEITPGKYESKIITAPGQWLVRVLVEVEGVRQRREQRVTIQ